MNKFLKLLRALFGGNKTKNQRTADNKGTKGKTQEPVYAELDQKKLNKKKQQDRAKNPDLETVYAEVNTGRGKEQELVYAEINHKPKEEPIYANVNLKEEPIYENASKYRLEDLTNIGTKDQPIYAAPWPGDKKREQKQQQRAGKHQQKQQQHRRPHHGQDKSDEVVYATLANTKQLGDLTDNARNKSGNQNKGKGNNPRNNRNNQQQERH